MTQPRCGSKGCLVDRLEKTLKEEHVLSRQIVTSQFESLKSDLSTIQTDVNLLRKESNANEKRLIVIETKELSRIWFKGIASQVLASVVTSVVIGAGIYFLFIYKIHP